MSEESERKPVPYLVERVRVDYTYTPGAAAQKFLRGLGHNLFCGGIFERPGGAVRGEPGAAEITGEALHGRAVYR